MSTLKECGTRTMDESFFAVNPGRKEYFEQKRLYQMQVLMAERCAGGCSYCATSSAPSEAGYLSTEKLFELVDEAAALGVKSICWAGGDPLLHPDWFKIACYALEKPIGFAGRNPELEPGLSEVRRANEYLARKLGQDWLRKGATPLASLFCQTDLSILATGDVLPCGYWPPELRVGNIFGRGIGEIFAENRDRILLRHEIKGKCGCCENNPVCIGCRANAYHYLGDEWESDPKCWLNPEAKEYYLSQ